jgi:sulfite reductase (NADPH) hemoprotein beta-component
LLQDDLYEAIDTILQTYLELRESAEESFLETVRRIGTRPFKDRVYVQA